MRYKEIVNTFKITRNIIKSHVKEGDVVLDCTVGNGKDTLQLAKIVGDSGRVYGFDIQKEALERTSKVLHIENVNNRVTLIEDSHENIDLYIKNKLDFIIYNLGYLPNGDKNIKTESFSTLISLNKSLDLLKNNGIIVITSYVGHEGGMDEKNAVENLLSKLDQKKYNVIKYDFINQRNCPPVTYGVEKSKF